MSKVKVSDIWAEDLLDWFESNVAGGGGDGAALIVCENYKEVATWFVDRWENKHGRKFFHPRDEEDNIVNYHDMNENYMFSNMEQNMFGGDYTFVVEGDCKFSRDNRDSCRVIKAAKTT